MESVQFLSEGVLLVNSPNSSFYKTTMGNTKQHKLSAIDIHIQWRSQYRGKGAECPLDSEKIVKYREKEGKNREKERKNREKEKKSGRKGQNREGSFTDFALLTNRAGYVTVHINIRTTPDKVGPTAKVSEIVNSS